MERAMLQGLLAALGLAAVLIGSTIFFLGAGHAIAATEFLFDSATGTAHPPTAAPSATIENEFRFYSSLWIAYGATLIQVARTLTRHLSLVPWLAAVFFAGGVGRVFAYLASGAPHPAFSMLMASELILPAIFVVLWWRVRQSPAPGAL